MIAINGLIRFTNFMPCAMYIGMIDITTNRTVSAIGKLITYLI